MNYEKELKIYYLFTLVDGSVSKEENQKFAELCSSKEFGTHNKSDIVKESEKLLNNDLVSRESNAMIALNTIFDSFSYVNCKDKLRILWNLINLAYSDKSFSEPERKVIDFVKKKIEIPEINYKEMIDIADTMLVLVKQKESLDSKSETDRVIIKGIDSKISVLFNQVKSLIELSDVK